MFDLYLPLKELSELANLDMSKRILIATEGLIKNVRDLIVESAKLAIQNNTNKISMPMLAKTFDKILYNQCEFNPFLPGYNT